MECWSGKSFQKSDKIFPNLSVVGDVTLATDDGLVSDLHQQGGHSDGVVVERRDVVDHLHCVQQPHQGALHLVWRLRGEGNII